MEETPTGGSGDTLKDFRAAVKSEIKDRVKTLRDQVKQTDADLEAKITMIGQQQMSAKGAGA